MSVCSAGPPEAAGRALGAPAGGAADPGDSGAEGEPGPARRTPGQRPRVWRWASEEHGTVSVDPPAAGSPRWAVERPAGGTGAGRRPGLTTNTNSVGLTEPLSAAVTQTPRGPPRSRVASAEKCSSEPTSKKCHDPVSANDLKNLSTSSGQT